MRKVTEIIRAAFMARTAKACGNSSTDGESLFLHGNKIARWNGNTLEITDAGWPTRTTHERLNGLPNVSVCSVRRVQHLNGKPWDGSWIAV